MKIIEVKSLVFPEIKVIRFARFSDERGFFTEIYRQSDFQKHPQLQFLKGTAFLQCNLNFSYQNVIRGLHLQWHPYMGKLVQTIKGRMIDLVLDVRQKSPTLGKIIAYDMPSETTDDIGQWIWVPPGFAHGSLFLQDSLIEYFCTSEWKAKNEASLSPLASDIDWSLADPRLKKIFDEVVKRGVKISKKDREGLTISQWKKDQQSENFIYPTLSREAR